MKYLILGCNGMAGHLVSLYLKENKHDVTGYARKDLGLVDTIIGDVRDSNTLKDTIAAGGYDAVINCIGILNQFAESDHENAIYINGYLPHFLAKVTENMPTMLVHLSTDCVFSGKTGNYTEKSLRDGETFYDRSKAIGELEDSKNLTLRCSIVGPDMSGDGIGLLNWFMTQKDSVQGYKNVIWTGLTTLELAKVIEKACEKGISGLVNAVPDECISKFELLKLFNSLRRNKIEIVPNENIRSNKSLVRTYTEGFNFKIPEYEDMIVDMSSWLNRHRDLYPHYADS